MKFYMTQKDIEKACSTIVGHVAYAELVNGVPSEELERPGFYFLVQHHNKTASARFYVGRQRSKSGFKNVLSQMRAGRSQLGRTIRDNGVLYEVHYLPIEKTKSLTTAYGKGRVASLFTSVHNEAFQNLEEINRMLSDNFHFTLQSY